MGEQRRRGIAVVLVVTLLATPLVPTVAAQATVDVTIDGAAVEDGDTVTVTDDPVVDIDIEANESIQSVVVRVDGESRRTFEPGKPTFSERVTLDLDDGEHTVTIVAESVDRQLSATVRKDSNSPKITYTSPFESAGYPSNGEVTITRGNTTLAAGLVDRSGVSEVRIEREYEWTFAGGEERDRETYHIENPGDNVSQPLLFGLGENDLKVEAIDEYGQRRTHDITVRVIDDDDPDIDLDRFERSANGELTVAGTVSDEVKVKSLKYQFEGTGQTNFVLNPTSEEPARERLDAAFEFTADPPDDAESVVLVATDVAGNTREWKVPFDYRGHLVPTVTMDREATGVQGDRIAFAGEVSDSRISRVVVGSIAPDGETIDTLTIHEGAETESVPFRGRIGGASGSTTLVVRVTDVRGGTHREAFEIDTSGLETPTTTSTRVDTGGLETPTATSTRVDNEDATPAAASETPTVTATTTPTPTAGGAQPLLPSGIPTPGLTELVVLGGLLTVIVVVRAAGPEIVTEIGDVVARYGTAGMKTSERYGRVVGRAIGGLVRATERAGAAVRALAAALVSTVGAMSDDQELSQSHDRTDETGDGRDRADGSTTPADNVKTLSMSGLLDLPADELSEHDIEVLVTALDADDPERVVQAANRLGDVATTRPELVAGTGATPRLRDLRMADDEEVRTATTQAVGKFRQAGLL